MQFKDVIGQDALKHQLVASFRNNRLSHALMFVGKYGRGSLPLAVAFAQYINCENPSEEDSCGVCSSCIKSAKLIHPDLHFTYPIIAKELKASEMTEEEKALGKKKWSRSTDYITEWREKFLEDPYMSPYDWMQHIADGNKIGNISVDECRAIIKKLNLKTFEKGCKVQIIWQPEALNKEGNILLKILEEPPPKTVFILVAENRNKILNTILSRTQQLQIAQIGEAELISALEQKESASPDVATQAARIADGSYYNARQNLTNTENENSQFLVEMLSIVSSGLSKQNRSRFAAMHKWIEDFKGLERESQKNFLKYTQHFTRELMIEGSLQNGFPKFSGNEQRMAIEIQDKLDLERIERFYILTQEAHQHIGRNAHPKILGINLMLSLAKLFRPGNLASHKAGFQTAGNPV